MRQAALRLLLGLFVTFALNCGSVSGGGSGTGGTTGTGTGGTTATGGATGTGGNHATGGSGGGTAGTNGTGGDHATGGHGGSAGATGSGGTTGTGGDHATGGSGGGGHAETGGSTGTGGNGGSGNGGAGAGGHAAGGQGGSGETCAQLASDYLAALPAARACTPGAANQCQTLEPITLGNCANCKFYVNDATALMPIVDQWTQQGCGSTGPVCGIACISPGNPGNCVATDSAAPGGVCGSSVATPN